MSVYLTICYLGLVAGPLIGSLILENLHWRWIFYVPTIVLSATAVAGFGLINWGRYGNSATRLRFLDTIVSMSTLSLLAIAVFKTDEPFNQVLLVVALVSFYSFCWFQTTRRNPLLQTKLFLENSIFATLGFTHFFYYCAIMATSVTITLYLQYIKAIDAKATDLVLIFHAMLTAIFAPLGGRLGHKIRARYLLFSGLILIAFSMRILGSIDFQTPTSTIAFALALTGIGVAITDAQLFNSVFDSVSDKLLSSASATLNGLKSLGGLVSIGVMSFLMGHHLGKQELIPSTYPELLKVLNQFYYLASTITAASLCCLSIGIWLRSQQTKSTIINNIDCKSGVSMNRP